MFTCIFHTLHGLSSRAVTWLLLLLSSLLTVLGRYSREIASIARAFPPTLYQRSHYLATMLSVPSINPFVVCRACLSLHSYEDCLEKCGTQLSSKVCNEHFSSSTPVPLLREVVTSNGSRKFYPHLVYPYVCLSSSLKSLLSRPGFYNQCEEWRNSFVGSPVLYSGNVWNEFSSNSFLKDRNSIAFFLNIDWFQPFKHRVYSIGVIYLAILNVPRVIRYKRENIILIGLIPGPSEPSKTMNTYLSPLVSELLTLWNGVPIVAELKSFVVLC